MVPRFDPSELPELARGWGYEPSAGETGELLAVAEAILSTLDLLDGQEPDLPAPVAAVREAGERPSAAEDPLNAWRWKCQIAGAPDGLLAGKTVSSQNLIVARRKEFR